MNETRLYIQYHFIQPKCNLLLSQGTIALPVLFCCSSPATIRDIQITVNYELIGIVYSACVCIIMAALGIEKHVLYHTSANLTGLQ